MLAVILFVTYRPRGGYLLARRRARVRREGVLARAQILSVRSEIFGGTNDHTRGRIYTIVYEVHAEGQTPFRAKGVDALDYIEVEANPIKEGAWVGVRFDPSSRVVALERVPAENAETVAQQYARSEKEKRERERALLVGRPNAGCATAETAAQPPVPPTTDSVRDMAPPEERTVTKQAANLLEEALKLAGDSIDEVGTGAQSKAEPTRRKAGL